jgi:hypothetical protein
MSETKESSFVRHALSYACGSCRKSGTPKKNNSQENICGVHNELVFLLFGDSQ